MFPGLAPAILIYGSYTLCRYIMYGGHLQAPTAVSEALDAMARAVGDIREATTTKEVTVTEASSEVIVVAPETTAIEAGMSIRAKIAAALGVAAMGVGAWAALRHRSKISDALKSSIGVVTGIVASMTGKGAAAGSGGNAQSAVSTSAFVMCLLRALETTRTDRPPIIEDKIAVRIFDKDGQAPLAGRITFYMLDTVFGILKEDSEAKKSWWKGPLSAVLVPASFSSYVDLIAVRTEFFDRQIRGYQDCKQLVIFGSGLDSRTYRLQSVLQGAKMRVFEVDFPKMLDEKRRLFQLAGCKFGIAAPVPVAYVATDLTQDSSSWVQDFQSYGYDPHAPTIWLLEGFTGYLMEDELWRVLNTIDSISVEGSVIVGAWLGTSSSTEAASCFETTMHKFSSDKPEKLMEKLGWGTLEKKSMGELLSEKRAPEVYVDDSYWFTCQMKTPAR